MKAWLSRAGVPFVEIDVRHDSQGFDEVLALGYRRVPLTTRGGQAVVGYDPAGLEALTCQGRGQE